MGTVNQFRGLLSLLLAAALVFFCGTVSVRANTQPVETTLPEETSESLPPETEAVTEIPETTVQTQLQETLPTVEETTETIQDTIPEETAETVPADAAPEETAAPEPLPAPVTISHAKTLEEGTGGIFLQGTVVFADYGVTVLQDITGGICLAVPEGEELSAGQVLQVVGRRSGGGITVDRYQVLGSADLPEEEATIDSIPECKRVVLRNAAFRDGFLMQGMASVPLTPLNPQGIAQGDTVDAWGVLVDGCFYGQTVVRVQKQIPVVTAAPADGLLFPGDTITLSCNVAGASISYAYSYDGTFYTDYAPYTGVIPVSGSEPNVFIRAYGKAPDGTEGDRTVFYFERKDQASTQTNTGSGGSDWNLYFGQLHAHTDLFGEGVTAADAFSQAAGEGLDFFAVTDHSDSFDNAGEGSITIDGSFSRDWKNGKEAAASATRNGAFVAIYGYEMSWPQMKELGHINTFGTDGWQSDTQKGFSTLESYYDALTMVPGSISQFNHPKDPDDVPWDIEAYGDFEEFGHYREIYDDVLHLLEVVSGNYKAYDYYDDALTAGWHVAPTNNQGSLAGEITQGRTVILAKSLTEQSIFDAIRNHRVYATEDSDLEIRYKLNGKIMGSTLMEPAQTAAVTLFDPEGIEGTRVELITKNGVTVTQSSAVENGETLYLSVPSGNTEECTYYYLRVIQSDGDMAVTAPVWVDLRPDVEIVSFSADTATPKQGQEVTLTLSLTNRSSADFIVDKMELLVEKLGYPKGTETMPIDNPGSLAPGQTSQRSISFLQGSFGRVDIRLQITGSLDGVPCSLESPLSLQYQIDKNKYVLQDIARVRQGTEGQVYRVKGYVTAGTSNLYNTFPDMLYLQDETGGIGVTAFSQPGISVGTPMELIGCLTEYEGDLALEAIQHEVLNEREHRYVPQALTNSDAMDWDSHGGQLVQVEGQVLSVTDSAGGVSRFTVKDTAGTQAVVRIDDAILSGTYGVNRLSAQVIAGSGVRAMGIVHREEDGTIVLRVRNCDEVTFVAAVPTVGGVADRTNPRTGTAEFQAPLGAGIPTELLLAVLCISAMGLAALYRLRKERRASK